ncbi:carbohydrate-binding domain-containing protein [Methylobacterium sp. SI9]|uniref:carbohydrate-binding domain-containing protein n=1 Tax=Methylobacterium guangdongense TaxID=3138811 RepID=UPI00313BCEF4
MKFNFIVPGSVNPADAVKQIHAFVVAHPGSVTGIEGPNEVNNFPITYRGLSGTVAAQAYQQDLYAAVKADPVLKGIPVLSFTDFPVSKAASDADNIHFYDKIGGQPRASISGAAADAQAVDPGKPVAITELGYQTSIPAGVANNWEGVDENTQAKLILNSVLDYAQLQTGKLYLYQLLDAYSDPQNTNIENHFGLFRLDNTPKPAATALHNLTTILSDSGSDASQFNPGGLAYSLSGMPSSAYSLLTQKSDSSYQIVVWNEPDIWNEQTHQPITIASSPVTVQLDQVFSTVQIFDPVSGTAPVQTLRDVSSVSLSVADRPFIIQVSGATGSGTSAPSNGAAGVATTVGTGPDKLVLKISEDAYKGDALYTVSVDGQQVGGTLTAHAAHGSGQSDTLTVQGSFGSGPHTVSLNFLNDAYDGSPALDRNLYLDAASYNGTAIAGGSLTFLNPGPQQFAVPGTSTGTGTSTGAAGVATTVGTGPDKLVLKISEDAYKGDALYTVSVDGQQVGGTLTAHAAHGSGQSDTLTVQGSFGSGPHTVSLNFLNDAYDGSPALDRNLYLDGASYNGTAIAGGSLTFLNPGPQQFAVPGTSTGTGTSGAVATTVGTGPDKLVLKISEDAYKGDALYTVSVDGQQVGGTLTAHAAHGSGQSDTLTVQGSFGAGPHTVSLNFLNDAYDGSPALDRNLYLDGASYNGTAIAGGSLTFLNPGPQQFAVPGTSTGTGTSGAVATTVGTGPDKLVLKISEDAYKGDALYTVSVDGQQVGGTLTAHAAHGSGQSDTLTVQGSFGAGPHTVSLNFLNDAYDGSPALDRNLYLDGASYNGTAIAGGSLTFLNPGPQQFAVPGTSTGTSAGTGTGAGVATTVGTGPDKLVLKISEDAYKGDALYTVSVDGQQVGGTLTAHAAHGSGQSDTLTVQGSFGAGPHTVSLNFLNDAYDGSPALDRNLYLDGASYNGTAIAGGSLTFLNPGPQQFAVPGTATSASGVATTSALMKTGAVDAAPSAPTVTLTHDTGTGGAHITSDGLLTYGPSMSVDTLHYKLDNGAFTTTAPVLAIDGSADGQHTITVNETSAAGLTSPDATLVFTLDTHHLTSGVHTV